MRRRLERKIERKRGRLLDAVGNEELRDRLVRQIENLEVELLFLREEDAELIEEARSIGCMRCRDES